MNLEEKYRLIFFRYLCNILNIERYEKYLESKNIDYITNQNIMCPEEIICSKYSKYFYLLNKVNIDMLNADEINYLEAINIDDNISDDIKQFLEKTYEHVLFSDDGDIYYGPMMNDSFKANSREIVLGIKYDEFGFAKGVIKELNTTNNETNKVQKVINNIEHSCKRLPIKVIKYNELYEKLNEDISIRL